MFNEDLKKRYIKEKKDDVVLPSNYLECQFNKIEETEIELNKDASDFTTYQIIEYYKTLNMTSFESLCVMNSHFSMYTQWCLQNNLVKDNQNHYLELDRSLLSTLLNKAILNKRIVDIKQIIEWCDSLPNPRDQFILLGLFEGIKGSDFNELIYLRNEDVNGNTLYLQKTNRFIEVSDRLVEYINESIQTNTYYSISGNATKVMPLVDNGYIIKNYPNVESCVSDFQQGRRIYNSISRCLSYVGAIKTMKANNIYESGKINMIKTKSSELGISTIEYIQSNEIKEVEEKYRCNIIASTFIKKYEDYLG